MCFKVVYTALNWLSTVSVFACTIALRPYTILSDIVKLIYVFEELPKQDFSVSHQIIGIQVMPVCGENDLLLICIHMYFNAKLELVIASLHGCRIEHLVQKHCISFRTTKTIFSGY